MIAAAAAAALPGVLLTLVVTTAVDAARAVAATGEERAMWRVLLGALRLVWRQPRRLLGVQVWGGLLILVAGAVYLALAWPAAYAGPAAFVGLMLLREVAVLARTGLRVATLAGMLHIIAAAAPASSRAAGAALEPGGPPEPLDSTPKRRAVLLELDV